MSIESISARHMNLDPMNLEENHDSKNEFYQEDIFICIPLWKRWTISYFYDWVFQNYFHENKLPLSAIFMLGAHARRNFSALMQYWTGTESVFF